MELATDLALLVLFTGVLILFGVLTLSRRGLSLSPQTLSRTGLVAGLALITLYGDGQTIRLVVVCTLVVIVVDLVRAVSRDAPELGRQVVIFMVPTLVAPVSIAVAGRGSLGEHAWVALAGFLLSCLGTSAAVYVKVSRRFIAANLGANVLIVLGALADLKLTGELPGTGFLVGMLVWAVVVVLSLRSYVRQVVPLASH